ncbi:MAG: hypothetical protein LBJ00_14200 [Planctomycetaceae bacterium]|nr:hypothetical protein [Planctomycetaceae bacterium]
MKRLFKGEAYRPTGYGIFGLFLNIGRVRYLTNFLGAIWRIVCPIANNLFTGIKSGIKNVNTEFTYA